MSESGSVRIGTVELVGFLKPDLGHPGFAKSNHFSSDIPGACSV